MAAPAGRGRRRDRAARLARGCAEFVALDEAEAARRLRAGAGTPAEAHAHVNLAPSARGTRVPLDVLRHVDARVGDAGLGSWAGEVNALAGRRAAALERSVGRVVHRVPNRTFSWVAGRPVERLTVVRTLQPTIVAN